MRKMDDKGLILCRFVSDLFEYSTKIKECSSKVFINAFVNSSLLKRIDDDSFIYESIDVPQAYEIIKKEKKLNRGKEIYPSYVMAWIGYIMKYFSYVTEFSLKYLYSKIKPEELYKLYEGYHGIDNDLVVKRIAEEKNINIDKNDIELFKRIYLNN